MRKLVCYLLGLLFLAAGLSLPALADSTANYSITGTYSTDTLPTPLTGGGASFSMNFSLLTNPTPIDFVPGDDFYLYPVNIAYGFGATTTTLASYVGFYVAAGSQDGGLFVDFCVDPACGSNLEYQWTFAGPPQYTGPESGPTLVPTSFVSDNQNFQTWDDTTLTIYDNSSISSTINGVTVNTPEPSSLLLLGAGLAGLALMARSRL